MFKQKLNRMSLACIEFKGQEYLAFQSKGNAAQFALPFAKHICKGIGYDIGYSKPEWKLVDAIGIDLSDEKDLYHADNLPKENVDFIFSSHCLEHTPKWATTLQYWIDHVKTDGVIFLYLPDVSQKYWRPWSNLKHNHVLTPQIVKMFFDDNERTKKLFVSEVDLNNSFMVVVQV
jgi:predicted SAM-dependent methyltransferase